METIKHISNAYTIYRNLPVNYVEGELDFCKAEFSYPTNDIVLSMFKNVLISKSGCIYTDYCKIVIGSLKKPTEVLYAYAHLAKSVFTKKKIKLNDNENYLVAFDGYTDGHYHWICDFLPRVVALGELTKDYVLILPYSSYILNIGIKMMELLQIKFKDIIYINEGEYFVCQKCFMVSHPCISGRIDDVLMKKIKKLIDQYIVGTIANGTANTRLYISRSNAKYRHLLNEKEVLPIIKDYGYEIINFEDYDILEQIKLCANADTIIGLHGAGLTNMIYMKAGSLITEFRRNKIYHNQCYWHLADSINIDYAYLFGTPDRNKVIEGNGCNLTLPPQKLINHLNLLNNRKINIT